MTLRPPTPGRRADLRPADLLEMKNGLAAWWASPIGRRFAEGWTEALWETREAGAITQDDLAGSESIILGQAEAYWVSDEMATVVAAAAVSMPPQALRADDLPAPCGFVWFDRPIYVTDRHGKRCGLRAVTWATRTVSLHAHADEAFESGSEEIRRASGISLTWYSDITDAEDDVNKELQERMTPGRWARYQREVHRLSVFHQDAWIFGTSFVPSDVFEEAMTARGLNPGEYVMENTLPQVDTRRVLASFLALQGQKMAVTRLQRADRAGRRRMERAGQNADAEVRVITLRRQYDPSAPTDEHGSGIEWSHRWMVSGHWRNQWVPTLDDHRLTWINPYVKGPEDKELLVKPTVYKVTR